MAKGKGSGGTGIVVPRMEREVIDVPVIGTSPLCVSRFPERSREVMRAKNAGHPKTAAAPVSPDVKFFESRYISTEGWDGIPAIAFKCAMVGVCRIIPDFPMTEARRLFKTSGQGFHPDGTSLVRVIGEPVKREAPCIGTQNSLIYCAMYWPWRAVVRLAFPKNILTVEKVLHLLEAAGEWEGVGFRRPGSKASNSGENGCFEIERE